MLSMMKFMLYCRNKNIDLVIVPITFDSLINRARNAAVAKFLSDPSATHLLFIDADIQFEPEDVMTLIATDRDVVGAAYPQKWLDLSKYNHSKRNPIELCTRMSVHLVENRTNSAEHVMKASYLTTGFLLIKRGVFETMMRAYPERQYINDIDGYSDASNDCFYDFFTVSINPETKKLESEDYGFCRLWTNVGGELHVATNVSLKHCGWFAYPGNLYRQLTEI